ncbi:MAG: magnesium transporter [Nocardiopsaceae bacterium]|nr:magnesium transporter [Nocardiopsaceae bacterium]
MSTSTASASSGDVTGRQVFTSRLRGRPFLDGDGLVMGRVRDVVLLSAAGNEPPQALGLVVQLRRRQIFVGFGRIGEIAADGAHLIGGTVDLGGFTLRPGELTASSLYGKRVKAGTVADVAITPGEELRRGGWEVSAVALREQRGLRRHGPAVVPWTECRELFDAGPEAGQLTGLREMRPADLATAVEGMPPSRRSQLAAALDDSELADLLEELPEADQIRLLDSLELERSADVVEEMEPDDAADLLGEMPPDKRERLLTAMQSVQAADLRRLLRYAPATAGGIMTSQPLIFTPEKTVAEVLARVRNPEVQQIIAAQVYVCEPPAETPTGLYLGSVGFQRLLRRPPSVQIGECIQSRVYIRPDLPERDLAVRLAAYDMVSVAVCDADGRLLGAATVDDVLDHMLPPDWRRKERR